LRFAGGSLILVTRERLTVGIKKRATLFLSLPLMALVAATFLFMASCVPEPPPTVDIFSPEDGATVVGIVSIEVNATDNSGVDSVECSIEGESVPMALISGDELDGIWQGYWDTTAIPDGFHTITVTARDSTSGRSVDSAIVVVDNVPPAPGSAEVQLRAKVIPTCPLPCR